MTRPELLREFLNPEWMEFSACADSDPEIFFPTSQAESRKGEHKKICGHCPVKDECLDFALVFDLKGVWGGLTETQRTRKYSKSIRGMMREDLFG